MKRSTIIVFVLLFFIGNSWAVDKPKKIVKGLMQENKSPDNIIKRSVNEETIILEEDFSKFTAGSEDAPDNTEIVEFIGNNPYIISDYIHEIGWMGYGIYQAGGSCFIDFTEYNDEYGDKYTDTGFLDTPYMDLSGNNGKFTVNFRARTRTSQSDIMNIISYQLTGDYDWREVTVTTNWQEYTLEFDNGTDATGIEFYTDASTCFIDDIKIIQEVEENDGSVKLLEPTIINNGFIANWEKLGNTNQYHFYLLETFTAPQAGTYYVLDEDFSRLTNKGGTFANPVYGEMEESLDGYTKIDGWEAMFPLFAGQDKMIGVSSTLTMLPGVVLSPRLDLSSNGGDFKVIVDGVAQKGNILGVAKGCPDELHIEPQVLLQSTFQQDRQTMEFEFNHEYEYAVGGIDLNFETTGAKTFLDKVVVTKELNEGDTFSYIYGGTTTDTSIPVQLEPKPGFTYSYSVVVMQIGGPAGVEFVGYKNRMNVPLYVELDTPTLEELLSIRTNTIQTQDATAYVAGDNLVVVLDEKENIELYKVSGQLVSRTKGNVGENILPLPEQGVYIVKTGDRVSKIIK